MGAVALRTRPLLPLLLLVLCTSGCLRRDGRNSDCHWPLETVAQPATPWHLGQDAEFAEDLAIRYADVHHGLRTPYYVSAEDYNSSRDACLASLFGEVARQHRVSAASLYRSLWHNRPYLDFAEVFSFALFYCVLSVLAARLIWRRYPPADGWIPFLLMMLIVSLGFAIGGTMLGEVWSWFVEGYRVANPHMSFRAQRLIWSRHPNALLAGAFALFCLAALYARRTQPRLRPGPASPAQKALPQQRPLTL